MAVQWKRGSQFKVDAEVAHEQIELIRKKNDGSVTADLVVKEAKKKSNPIHECFEWDDTVAAENFRLSTARVLMHSLVVIRDELKTDRPQRVYEVVRQPQVGRGRIKNVYKSMDDIMKDEDSRAELLGRALRELISIRNKYRDLQELAIVMRAIDELVETQAP